MFDQTESETRLNFLKYMLNAAETLIPASI